MKKILDIVRSMKTMAVLMLIYAVSIGWATIIENDYGTPTAKAEIFNARWFEALHIILAVNLLLNMYRFKMFQKKKFFIALFHVAFIMILVGAAITRYFGYEGTMHIRENATSHEMTSTQTYFNFAFKEGEVESEASEPVLLSRLSEYDFSKEYTAGSKKVKIELVEKITNASVKTVESKEGKALVSLMVTTAEGAKRLKMREGEFVETNDLVLDFNSGIKFDKPVIALFKEGDELHMSNPMHLKTLSMDTQLNSEVNSSTNTQLHTRTLYSSEASNFVMREYFAHAEDKIVGGEIMLHNDAQDALRFKVSVGSENKIVTVFGQNGRRGQSESVEVGGVQVTLSYGAKMLQLPFSLKLVNFDLERYPGSMSPSSYASDVVLIDEEQSINEPYRIFMNHVLEHRGYRFFQSSYDQDEKGTILSVNNDPGTLPTYIGYTMLAVGFFISLFMPNGRFAKLSIYARELGKKRDAMASFLVAFSLLFSLNTTEAKAEDVNPVIKKIMAFDKEHADKFATLVIQDSSGRMKPIDTLAVEVLNKLYRNDTILGLSASQVMLGMMIAPDAWREINMIKTSHKKIAEVIGLKKGAKAASFSQFFEYPDEVSGYKLASFVEEAARKAPKDRNKFDQAVLKVDERVNIAYLVYTGALLKMWPKPYDETQTWYATIDAMQNFTNDEGNAIRELAVRYFSTVEDALTSGDWKEADIALHKIVEYQKFYGATVYPDSAKLQMEMWQNHARIFERLWPLYFAVGFILLFLSFAQIIKPSIKIGFAKKSTFFFLTLFFIAHTIGLAIRWYISGHAPWSNGYESMIYIAWASVLAGFIFSKNSAITMAATGILTGLILFVAHLNWMDPQVTNLVPVLQSYWLSIHVSMITASYGFLALGALLGFITLILFAIKTENNDIQISLSIKELNAINELSLMIGLMMLTVGNFLGGVWANESWGRYWGWDPKETWALVTIFIYAVVVHIRFIKAIYTPFVYSVISLLAFTSVLMTYFGVNYYLAGLHSYAKGDPVPIPEFVPISYAIVFLLIAIASRNRILHKG